MIDKLIAVGLLGFAVGAILVMLLSRENVAFFNAVIEMFEHHDDCVGCVQGNSCCTVCKAMWRRARRLLG